MPAPDALRRVVVGLDADGRSAVVRIDEALEGATRATGNTVHELWWQERIPGAVRDATSVPGADQPRSAAGVAIRRLSIPPAGPNGEPTAVSSGGSGELHRTGCLYVGTVVLGAAYLLLESEPVLLSEGDTFVLPDSLHSWHNPFDRAAIIVSAAFPLLADQR